MRGQIHLRANLATREDRGISEEDNWTDIKQHVELLQIFIDHELNRFKVRRSLTRNDRDQSDLSVQSRVPPPNGRANYLVKRKRFYINTPFKVTSLIFNVICVDGLPIPRSIWNER